MSTGSGTSAIDQEIMKDLVELSLIELYGWTPEYISKLPYKWIQKHNLIKRIKNEATAAKRAQQEVMAQVKSSARGF
jgi:hypothetical protein